MFRDRIDAGERLGNALVRLGLIEPVVLGMARGGVPVAAEISRILAAPLDVIVARKIGHPRQPELGLGAIAEGGVRVINDDLVAQLDVAAAELETVVARETAELDRRVLRYRVDRPPVAVAGRVVILVDDGLATGYTARAAIASIRARDSRTVIMAVPVAPTGGAIRLGDVADEVIVLETPDRFFGVGGSYRDFRQVTDQEVIALL